uniref:CHCH domain-containing protein n=1 Tax=Tabanus bromius TaxID=304241 RepID=A0A0K8TP06_TABBR
MSYCKEFGKDKVMFVTKEDHAEPSKIELPQTEPAPGLILANGEINWNCPCLGGMATGPCGVEFREAFSCFHYSTAEPKGSNCYDSFKEMQDCFSKYPAVYNKTSTDDDEEDLELPNLNDLNDMEEEPGRNNDTVDSIEENVGPTAIKESAK